MIAGNKIFEETLIIAKEKISEGRSILSSRRGIPLMVVQMVQVGESSGALDNMLNKIANFYEDDVDNLVSNMAVLVEPMIMTFLSIILGGLVVVAMYLPIFELWLAVG